MSAKVVFENAGTDEGRTEWWVVLGGMVIGSMDRERPSRPAAGARRGMVQDRGAPYQWQASIEVDGVETTVHIPEGASVAVARELVRALVR